MARLLGPRLFHWPRTGRPTYLEGVVKVGWAAALLLGGCGGPDAVPPPDAAAFICADETHETNAVCVGDARFEVRAAPMVRADGYSRSSVFAFGIDDNGLPSHDVLSLSVDRSSSGTIVSPLIALGDLGAATSFIACNAVDAGCTGPALFSIALASTPQVPLAELPIELVAPPSIGSTAACLTGGNVLHFDAQNYGANSTLTISSNGVFDVSGAANRVGVHVVANNVGWSLELNTMKLEIPLIRSVFDNAKPIGYAVAGEATYELSDWPCEAVASFQVHEFVYDSNLADVTLITATFEEYCNGNPSRRRTGCVHYAQ